MKSETVTIVQTLLDVAQKIIYSVIKHNMR